MTDPTLARSFGAWWRGPTFMYWRFMVGVLGLAIAGLGLFASGTMGVVSYFFDEPVWFSVLVVAGLLQMAAAWALVAGRYGRLALGALAPALAIGGYAISQSGDWNLMLAEVALTVLVVTARHNPKYVPRTGAAAP